MAGAPYSGEQSIGDQAPISVTFLACLSRKIPRTGYRLFTCLSFCCSPFSGGSNLLLRNYLPRPTPALLLLIPTARSCWRRLDAVRLASWSRRLRPQGAAARQSLAAALLHQRSEFFPPALEESSPRSFQKMKSVCNELRSGRVLPMLPGPGGQLGQDPLLRPNPFLVPQHMTDLARDACRHSRLSQQESSMAVTRLGEFAIGWPSTDGIGDVGHRRAESVEVPVAFDADDLAARRRQRLHRYRQLGRDRGHSLGQAFRVMDVGGLDHYRGHAHLPIERHLRRPLLGVFLSVGVPSRRHLRLAVAKHLDIAGTTYDEVT